MEEISKYTTKRALKQRTYSQNVNTDKRGCYSCQKLLSNCTNVFDCLYEKQGVLRSEPKNWQKRQGTMKIKGGW